MAQHRTLILLTGMLLTWGASRADEQPRPAGASRAEVDAWVKQLGDDSFAVREEASGKLRAAGKAAWAALVQASKQDDPEVRNRARSILDNIQTSVEFLTEN